MTDETQTNGSPEGAENETVDVARDEKLNELAILQQSLDAEKGKTAEAHEKFLRLAAEFSNYKTRVEKERKEIFNFAHKGMLAALLPVLDSFEKAVTHEYETKEAAVESMKLMHTSLVELLKKEGLSRMETVGVPFDPNVHEAVGFDERDDIADNTVTTELHAGYMLHNKVLRPAMVRISKIKNVQ